MDYLTSLQFQLNPDEIFEFNLGSHANQLPQLKPSSLRWTESPNALRTDYTGARNKLSTEEIDANDRTEFKINVSHLPLWCTFDEKTTIVRCANIPPLEFSKPSDAFIIPVIVFRTDVLGKRRFMMNMIFHVGPADTKGQVDSVSPVDVKVPVASINKSAQSSTSSSCFENKCVIV